MSAERHAIPEEDATEPRPTRLRCTQCGNLTRFDVIETRRTRAFHHYALSGALTVEDEEVLSVEREAVSCRWCGSSEVEEVANP